MCRAQWEVGRNQIARLIEAADLRGIRRGLNVFTTSPAGVPDLRPDLVERNYGCQHASTPGVKNAMTSDS